jgi:hypothetical protein
MTDLCKFTLEKLHGRDCWQATVAGYIRTVADFEKSFQKPPDQLGGRDPDLINCTYSTTATGRANGRHADHNVAVLLLR